VFEGEGLRMLNNDQGSSIFWFLFGVIVIIGSIPYGLGSLHRPATGFVPFLTGFAICILSGIGFIAGTKRQRKGEKWKSAFKGLTWHNPLIAFAAIIVYALVIEWLGFLITSFLLVGFLLRVIIPQKWWVVIVGATLTSIIFYAFFQIWLGTQLPKGILNF
jgi:hypothetical protein